MISWEPKKTRLHKGDEKTCIVDMGKISDHIVIILNNVPARTLSTPGLLNVKW